LFTPPRGWHHAEGGIYVMRCEDCGHRVAPYPSPRACPSCGSVRGWRDDRCAQAAAEAIAPLTPRTDQAVMS